VENGGIGYGVVPIMVTVLSILALGACDEPTRTADSGVSLLGLDVQAAGFVASTWGDGLAGGADLVLTSTPLSCADLSTAAWGTTYYSDLQAGAGVVLRLAFAGSEGGLDPWAGTYAHSALVPQGDTGQPERLGAGRTARALWFDPGAWIEESGGLVVEVSSAGPAGVGFTWHHPWGEGELVAGNCGALPYWLADVSGPGACEAYVVSYNACATTYGIGSSRTPESLACDRVSDPLATTYLCRAEAHETADCTTQEGWEAALVAAGACGG